MTKANVLEVPEIVIHLVIKFCRAYGGTSESSGTSLHGPDYYVVFSLNNELNYFFLPKCSKALDLFIYNFKRVIFVGRNAE
jgi:hypothetical protein